MGILRGGKHSPRPRINCGGIFIPTPARNFSPTTGLRMGQSRWGSPNSGKNCHAYNVGNNLSQCNKLFFV